MPTGVYIRTAAHRKIMSESHIGILAGSAHPNWKGGVTPIHRKIYNSFEYKAWRKAVFERDDYTCVWCGERGGELNADHIKQFAYHPELRFDLNNGRTLCVSCHRQSHTYGSWDYSKEKKKRTSKVNNGSFKKGHTGYKSWLGKKFSDEHRKNLSESHKKKPA